jgi:hypothetical protein
MLFDLYRRVAGLSLMGNSQHPQNPEVVELFACCRLENARRSRLEELKFVVASWVAAFPPTAVLVDELEAGGLNPHRVQIIDPLGLDQVGTSLLFSV